MRITTETIIFTISGLGRHVVETNEVKGTYILEDDRHEALEVTLQRPNRRGPKVVAAPQRVVDGQVVAI
jgi:hypothetical protein